LPGNPPLRIEPPLGMSKVGWSCWFGRGCAMLSQRRPGSTIGLLIRSGHLRISFHPWCISVVSRPVLGGDMIFLRPHVRMAGGAIGVYSSDDLLQFLIR